MGFSLALLFNDLLIILGNEEMDEQDRLELLTTIINEQYEYAKQCGQLK